MVQVHLYLMLLDYTSPPFSRNVGDAIHAGLQGLLAVEWIGSGDSSSIGEMEAKGRLLPQQAATAKGESSSFVISTISGGIRE